MNQKRQMVVFVKQLSAAGFRAMEIVALRVYGSAFFLLFQLLLFSQRTGVRRGTFFYTNVHFPGVGHTRYQEPLTVAMAVGIVLVLISSIWISKPGKEQVSGDEQKNQEGQKGMKSKRSGKT